MGLVRLSLCLVCCSLVLQAHSQTTISTIVVSAIWNEENGSILVTEKMQFDNTESNERIKFHFLPVGDAVMTDPKLFADRKSVPLKIIQDQNGLSQMELIPGETGIIHLEYEVEANESMLIVPLIFPNMKGIRSNENLFSATVSIPNGYKIINSFPTMEAEAMTEGKQIVYHVSLPVIPSMLRVDVSKSVGLNLSTIDVLDGAVLAILALVGIVGWRKRKMLI